jgi:hypothetical protein
VGVSSDLDQIVAEVGDKPKPTAKGFHVGTYGGNRCPVYLGVLYLRTRGSEHYTPPPTE